MYQKGLKIYGFGASVGTTTLVYDFEIENKIKYIFDNEKEDLIFARNKNKSIKS